MKIQGSPQQEAIWQAIERKGAPHLVIDAKAGTGKTFTIVQGVSSPKLPRGLKAILLAFGNPIAAELQHKLKEAGAGPLVKAQTYNAFGLGCLRENLGNNIVLEEDKLSRLISNRVPSGDLKYLEGPIEKVVRLLKCHMLDGNPADVDTLMDRYAFDWAPSTVSAIKVFAPLILDDCLEDSSTIDFDDQIWLAVKRKVPIAGFHLVMVDEGQDTNEMQKQLIMMAARSLGRIVVVGDSYQCQPPDSLISTTLHGPVPLCDVVVGDEVVGFNSRKTYFPGTVSQGRRILEIVRRDYKGPLIRVFATPSGHSSGYTPEHRCLVRLTNLERYAVYAMRRGQRVRVGVCRLMYPGNSGIAMRARQERADAAWILLVEDKQENALLQEERIAAKFGLSQTIFENSMQATPSQKFIDQLYSWLEDNDRMIDKLETCLKWFGRKLEFPIWTRDGHNSHVGRKSFVTQACNLVEGMLVKVFDGDQRDSRWEPIEVSIEEYDGQVISLRVEPAEDGRPLYIADGIVTHNSIYGFRGAGTHSMEELKETLSKTERGCEVMPLTVCRRCPKSHIEYAQRIVPEIEAMPDAILGSILNMSESEAVSAMVPGDLVISRVNAPLVSVAYTLIKSGRKAVIRGRDIGNGLSALLKRLKPESVKDLLGKISTYQDKEITKLEALGRKGLNRIMTLIDKCECLIVMTEGVDTLEEIELRIETVFRNFEPDGRPKLSVILGTMHRTKGLEANSVYVLSPHLIPHPSAKLDWEREQEKHLAYVAMTRSKDKIVFCGPTPAIYLPHEEQLQLEDGFTVPAGVYTPDDDVPF